MSGSPLMLLQRAVYARLNDDATLGALVTGVYDDIPEGTAFPYVTIGEVTESPADTMGDTGRWVTIKVHYWARSTEGMEDVHEIHDRVDSLLDRWSPTVAGWDASKMGHEFYDTFRDPDGITRHGVARYRIHLQQQ